MAAKTTTTCVNTALGILLGFGAPIGQGFDQTALTGSATITVNIVSQGTQQPVGITKGKMRVQCTVLNAATTVAIAAPTATDGTTTVQVGGAAMLATTAAGTKFDLLREFALSIAATSFSFVYTLGGGTTTATINTEIYGNP